MGGIRVLLGRILLVPQRIASRSTDLAIRDCPQAPLNAPETEPATWTPN